MSTETNLSFTPENHNEAAYFIRLVATNEYGCSDVAYGKVTRLTGNFVYVPNAFTPDGNEANNVFVPVFYNPEDIQDYRFEIFDRWGECVFRSSTVNESWDGIYKGKLSKDGIYTWKLQFNNVRDQEDTELTGHVTVLR
jgi:gliding motility-associated-like protein